MQQINWTCGLNTDNYRWKLNDESIHFCWQYNFWLNANILFFNCLNLQTRQLVLIDNFSYGGMWEWYECVRGMCFAMPKCPLWQAGPSRASHLYSMGCTAGCLNLLVDDRHKYESSSWELWGCCSYFCVCCISSDMYFYVYVSCQAPVSAGERASQQVQTANTLTCLTHSAPEPLMGALYRSRLVQPLKQAPGLQQRLGPKPSLHSPHKPSCLFSEALEETLDRAYQIQTVARLCYFTHRAPLNSASFSVIVFFLAW